jgi:uncharacterized protein (TIGR03382 family)
MTKRYGIVAIAGLAMASAAQAGFVDLGGGWTAQWDAGLDPYVDVQSYGVVNGDTLVIQKSAEFTSFPQVIDVLFVQTDPGAVPYIAIDDEIITNSTPVDWTDFHMETVGNASFNPALTGGGGGPIGFSIDPFTQAAFQNGDTLLNIDGGVVPTGTQWYPGDGATNGLLFINALPSSSSPNTFILREYPTPTPGAMSLLGLAGLGVLRRRR